MKPAMKTPFLTILLAIFLAGCGESESSPDSQVARLIQLDPFWVAAGDAGVTLQLIGVNFTSSSVALWNGVERPTRFIGAERIEVDINSNDLASRKVSKISVRDANGMESNYLPFFVKTSVPRFIYVTTPADPNGVTYIYAYSVDSTSGDLDVVPGSPFEFQAGTSHVVVTPSGSYMYLLDGGTNSVLLLSIDGLTGELSETGMPPLPDVEWISMDPAGEYLFTSRGIFAVDPNSGDLSDLPVSIDNLQGLADASARFAFRFEGNRITGPDYTVHWYWFNRTTAEHELLGSLTLEERHTALGGIADPTGGRILGVTQDSLDVGSLISFNIQSMSGALEKAPESIGIWRPFSPASRNVFHPSGRYAFSLDTTSTGILLTNIDLQTGAVSAGPIFELPYDTSGLVIASPTGKHLYVTVVASGTDRRQFILSIPIDDQTGVPDVASAREFLLDRVPRQAVIVQ